MVKNVHRKSNSLDSLHKRRRPTPIAEQSESEYIDIQVLDLEVSCDAPMNNFHCDELDETSSFRSLEVNSRVRSSSVSFGSEETSLSSTPSSRTSSHPADVMPPGGWRSGRRMSMPPCTRETAREGVTPCRTDAQIVQSVEEEIQERIMKRKQQLLKGIAGGGGATMRRMYDRSRSSGVRLKKVIEDLNNKRTTAELIEIASAKNATKTESLYELSMKVQNVIKVKDSR